MFLAFNFGSPEPGGPGTPGYIPGGPGTVVFPPITVSGGDLPPAPPYQFGFPGGTGPIVTGTAGSGAGKPPPPGEYAPQSPVVGGGIVPFKKPVVN